MLSWYAVARYMYFVNNAINSLFLFRIFISLNETIYKVNKVMTIDNIKNTFIHLWT